MTEEVLERHDAATAEVGGGDNVAVADAPAAPAASDDSSRSDEDPLDKLLADYDRSIGAGGNGADDVDPLDRLIADAGAQEAAAAQRELEWQAFQQQTAQQRADASIAVAARDHQVAELQQTVGHLQQVIAAEQWRQQQEKSREAFEKLASREQEKLSDVPGIDEDHVRRWLLSEAAQDPRLGEAWEASRYYEPPGPVDRARIASHIQQWGENQAKLALQLPDPRARVLAQQNIESEMRRMWEAAFPDPAAHRAAASRYVQKALDRLHREARRPRIDVDATESRLLVAQAVRGASGKTDVRDPPPNLGAMDDRQFQNYTRQFGF